MQEIMKITVLKQSREKINMKKQVLTRKENRVSSEDFCSRTLCEELLRLAIVKLKFAIGFAIIGVCFGKCKCG